MNENVKGIEAFFKGFQKIISSFDGSYQLHFEKIETIMKEDE